MVLWYRTLWELSIVGLTRRQKYTTPPIHCTTQHTDQHHALGYRWNCKGTTRTYIHTYTHNDTHTQQPTSYSTDLRNKYKTYPQQIQNTPCMKPHSSSDQRVFRFESPFNPEVRVGVGLFVLVEHNMHLHNYDKHTHEETQTT